MTKKMLLSLAMLAAMIQPMLEAQSLRPFERRSTARSQRRWVPQEVEDSVRRAEQDNDREEQDEEVLPPSPPRRSPRPTRPPYGGNGGQQGYPGSELPQQQSAPMFLVNGAYYAADGQGLLYRIVGQGQVMPNAEGRIVRQLSQQVYLAANAYGNLTQVLRVQ